MELSKYSPKNMAKNLGIQIPIIVGAHFILIIGILSFALIKGYQISNTRTVEYGTLLVDVLAHQEKHNINAAKRILDIWNKKIQEYPDRTDYCGIFMESSLDDEITNMKIVSYGAVTPDLIIDCAPTNPQLEGRDSAARKYISTASEKKMLTRSGYQVGQVSGKATTAFAYPVLNNDGSVRTILILSTGLSWMTEAMSELPIPQGSEILRLDSEGNILAKVPSGLEPVGSAGLPTEAFNYIKETENGYFDAQGRDRIRRTYTYTPVYVGENKEPDTYIVVGLPKSTFIKDVDNLRDKIILLMGITFLLEFLIVTLYARAIVSPTNLRIKNRFK